MNTTILPNGNLLLTIDEDERKEFAEHADDCPKGNAGDCDCGQPEIHECTCGWDSDGHMHDLFEPFICNSEFEWINPEDIGALTDAPILGVSEYDESKGLAEVKDAWAFMDYQVISLQRRLMETGQAELQHGGDHDS